LVTTLDTIVIIKTRNKYDISSFSRLQLKMFINPYIRVDSYQIPLHEDTYTFLIMFTAIFEIW